MDNVSLLIRTEREIYANYEQTRRLRLLRGIVPAFLVVVILAVLILTVFVLITASLALALVVDGVLGGIGGVLLAALIALRRTHVGVAAILTVLASGLGAFALQLFWASTNRFDAYSLVQFSVLTVVIILSGILGNTRFIVLATIAVNVMTLITIVLVTNQVLHLSTPFLLADGQQHSETFTLVLPNLLLGQWIFAAIMLAVSRSFQQSLGELGVAYERSKQLEELKDQFISSVNHELRTPIMTMQMYVQTAFEEYDHLPKEQIYAALGQSTRVGNQLTQLVQSILSTRRIDETMQITPERVALRAVLVDAIALLDLHEIGDAVREVQILLPVEAQIWGDAIRLQQVFTNLLSNAIKYSPAGTPIAVTATLQAGEMVPSSRWRRSAGAKRQLMHITVQDQGYGIPPEQIPLLFNRFVRLPRDLASNTMGNGLGLYLCRIFVEAMGGTIWVESTGNPDAGSTFHVLLPTPMASPRS